jgi:hypothetical protein
LTYGDRYVVLGVARPRADWFRSVAQWATSAALPAEFLKCVSIEELRARLGSGRIHSAVLLDGTLPAVDREVIQAARAAGSPVFVVDDGNPRRDWIALGAVAVLPTLLTRETLLDALATHAEMVGRMAAPALDDDAAIAVAGGAVAAVCGPGGTGASTVAAALAEGVASGHRHGDVLLADLALNAEQAMLHDVRDIAPGVQELVEAHRARQCSVEEVRALTFQVVARRYHLLLGLRRTRYWSTLRPRSFEVAFEAMRSAFDVVVCDVTGDVEGEDAGGSIDVEERNLMARTAVMRADAVFAVGRPGIKGLHALVRFLEDLVDVGIAPSRVVPVFNGAPRHPRARAELASALADLAGSASRATPFAPPVFLPSRKVDEAIRDAVALPAPLPALLSGAFDAVIDRSRVLPTVPVREPELVAPGSLGMWSDGEGTR